MEAKMKYEKPSTLKHESMNLVQGSYLYYTSLYYTSLYYTSLYYVSLYYVSLYYTSLYYYH